MIFKVFAQANCVFEKKQAINFAKQRKVVIFSVRANGIYDSSERNLI